MRKASAVIVFLLFSSLLFSQEAISRVDSLLKQLNAVAGETIMDSSFFESRQRYETVADSAGNSNHMIDSRNLLVFRYYMEGNTDSLAAAVHRVKVTSREYDNLDNYYDMWSYLLNMYVLQGLTETAIESARIMEQEAIADDYPFGISISQSILGDANQSLGLSREAIKHYKKALEITKDMNIDESHKSDICYYLNIALASVHEYGQMLTYANQIDSLTDRLNFRRTSLTTNNAYYLVAMCSRTIAYSYIGELEKAKNCLDRAAYFYNSCETQLDYYLEAKGTYYAQSGLYSEAIAVYDTLIDYYKSLGLNKEVIRFTKETAYIYGQKGDYQQGWNFYNHYVKANDSLTTANSYMQLNEFATISNLNLVELERQKIQVEYQRSQQKLTFILAVLIFIIAGAATIFYLFERRHNRKLKQSDVNLRKALQKAEQSDRLKSAFFANMSHEIRTPLNSIVGFSNLLVEAETPEEKEQYSNIISSNSDLLITLVNDVLDLAKIESGTVEIRPAEFEMCAFFEELAGGFRQKISNPNVTLIYQAPYRSCTVYLDKSRVAQLVTNYITNAIKFTKEGHIKMGFKYEDNGIIIEVADTGIGIPEEKKEAIFERFVKLDDFAQGTGLGMSICKAIVSASGGKMGLDSKEGEGSTFWAWIPCSSVKIEP